MLLSINRFIDPTDQAIGSKHESRGYAWYLMYTCTDFFHLSKEFGVNYQDVDQSY